MAVVRGYNPLCAISSFCLHVQTPGFRDKADFLLIKDVGKIKDTQLRSKAAKQRSLSNFSACSVCIFQLLLLFLKM